MPWDSNTIQLLAVGPTIVQCHLLSYLSPTKQCVISKLWDGYDGCSVFNIQGCVTLVVVTLT